MYAVFYSNNNNNTDCQQMGKVFRYCAKNYLKKYGKQLTKNPLKATKMLFNDIGSFFKRVRKIK